MWTRCWSGAAVALLAGCGGAPPAETVAKVSEEFVYGALAQSPVSATSAGYHRHGGQPLDELLDDYSPAGIERSRAFLLRFRDRLARLPADGLSPQDRADREIVANQIALGLLELDALQNWRRNPTLYVELAGNALFTPLTLEYAPAADRFRHIIERLKRLPRLLEQARANLEKAPAIWTQVAIEENQGNLALIGQEIRGQVPPALRADYDAAAGTALDALRAFDAFLKTELSRRADASWRLGEENYRRKFALVFATDRPPAEVLAEAERDLAAVHARMAELSAPLYRQWFPGRKPPADRKQLIRAVLDRIAERHASPAQYKADAERDLAEAREFIRAKNILPLPPRDNLKVIDTPAFMRGIYAVGGFNPAPALEPQLGAFYWLTPIPPDWPPARIDSKLREYNFYKLKLLTIHEAMPGHYVQFEYANAVQPFSRRLVRSVYGDGPYIEGWAQYITEVLLDEGYLDGAPELRLTFLKEELRVLANAILDIRLHTREMSDEQALRLMMEDAFQEREEAVAKLQRAKLSSCQLPTYLVGWRAWRALRQRRQRAPGDEFQLAEFHRQALSQGAVPMSLLETLLPPR
jgi:uncharacterized protein (DUF885 family)